MKDIWEVLSVEDILPELKEKMYKIFLENGNLEKTADIGEIESATPPTPSSSKCGNGVEPAEFVSTSSTIIFVSINLRFGGRL
jgi:hypothetical protein